MSTAVKADLEKYIEAWITAHAEAENFNWSQWWYDGHLSARMAEAAYTVFMAAREAQDFAKARGQESG